MRDFKLRISDFGATSDIPAEKGFGLITLTVPIPQSAICNPQSNRRFSG
jgi:hypothetical protein